MWQRIIAYQSLINTLRPRQNGRRFADDTFKRIFLNENVRISIKISLKFVPKGPINNNPALVQIMAWRRPGDKPLSEPMMVRLLTHICVTRPQWVNTHVSWSWECSMLSSREIINVTPKYSNIFSLMCGHFSNKVHNYQQGKQNILSLNFELYLYLWNFHNLCNIVFHQTTL